MLTNLRSLFHVHIEGVTDAGALHFVCHHLHESVVDFGLYVDPGASTTTLTLVEEQAEVGLLYGVLHWWAGRAVRGGAMGGVYDRIR